MARTQLSFSPQDGRLHELNHSLPLPDSQLLFTHRKMEERDFVNLFIQNLYNTFLQQIFPIETKIDWQFPLYAVSILFILKLSANNHSVCQTIANCNWYKRMSNSSIFWIRCYFWVVEAKVEWSFRNRLECVKG